MTDAEKAMSNHKIKNLIATKIMGWKKVYENGHGWWEFPVDDERGCTGLACQCYDPTTDIAQAFDALERWCEKHDIEYSLDKNKGASGGHYYLVILYKSKKGRVSETAKTIAAAIVAALCAAVEKDSEGGA